VPRQFVFPVVRVGKPLAFCVLALPLALLGIDVWREFQLPGSGLGPDPGEDVVHHLGTWGLRTLLLTLAVSPASRLFKRPQLVRYRRMVGLWAFTYLVLHFLSYFWLLGGYAAGVAIDGRRLGFAEALVMDIYKRPYITAGFLALVLLIPLAITSTRGWQRRLRRRWKTLHRLVYPAAIAAQCPKGRAMKHRPAQYNSLPKREIARSFQIPCGTRSHQITQTSCGAASPSGTAKCGAGLMITKSAPKKYYPA